MSNEPQTWNVKGIDITCPVCQNNTFTRDKAQLNTATAEFFNMGWSNRSASLLICERCTYILWFDIAP